MLIQRNLTNVYIHMFTYFSFHLFIDDDLQVFSLISNIDIGELSEYFSTRLTNFKGVFEAVEDLNRAATDSLSSTAEVRLTSVSWLSIFRFPSFCWYLIESCMRYCWSLDWSWKLLLKIRVSFRNIDNYSLLTFLWTIPLFHL